MKTIKTSFGDYYVDCHPAHLKSDYERAKENVKLFNAHYCDEDTLAFLGYMSDIKQPSKATVSRAMIWGYDDYKIKSGGESMSDNIYSSSLVITIDNNGEDKDVVLIKKYSTVFENVLITYDEIKELYFAIETLPMKKGRLHSEICGTFKYYTHEYLKAPQKSKEEVYQKLLKVLTEEKKISIKVLNKFRSNTLNDINDYTNYDSTFTMLSEEMKSPKYWEKFLKISKERLSLIDKLLENIK